MRTREVLEVIEVEPLRLPEPAPAGAAEAAPGAGERPEERPDLVVRA